MQKNALAINRFGAPSNLSIFALLAEEELSIMKDNGTFSSA